MSGENETGQDDFIDMPEALDFWLKNRLLAIHTAVPGTIQNYDSKNRKCDVKPAVNLPFPGGRMLEPPVIQSVPVCIPGSAQYMLDFEIPNGTTCEVHFSEVGIGQWLKGAKQPDADNPSKFKLTDAMVIPGLWQYGKVPAVKNGVIQKGDDVEHKAVGTHAINASEVNLNNGSKGVARLDDAVLSTSVDDPIFWTWIAAVATLVAGLGVVAPIPTQLLAKITSASTSVKAGN